MKSTFTKMLLITLMLAILIPSISHTNMAHAEDLLLTINTKEYYNLGETINMNGTLTLDGSPVLDGLVSIQINNPRGNNPQENLFLIRTIQTGPVQGPWTIGILEAYTCDKLGNAKSTFKPGGGFGFKVTAKNNGAMEQPVIVAVTLCYSNGVPFSVLIMMNQTLAPGAEMSRRRWIEGFIPGNAPLGTAHAYTVAVDNWTQYEGLALCPENSTTFNIALSAMANINQETGLPALTTLGSFNLSFMISDHGGILGNYTIYATSWYNFMFFASAQKTFEALLIADVIEDGIVDMADISAVVDAFLAEPGDPRWNPRADLLPDKIIDMADVSIVVDNFLKEGQY
jgi:hypothetical protein